MITYQYAPAVDGGAERQCQRLAEALAARGRKVSVVTTRARGSSAFEELERVGVHRVWSVSRRGCLSATFLPSLGRFLLTHGSAYDIWHVHQAYYNALVSTAIARILNRRCVIKTAASGPYGDIARLKHARMGSLVLRAVRRADTVISLNRELTAELIETGVPESRIRVIPNGVDTESFSPPSSDMRKAARAALGIGDSRVVALYVGRLAYEKGLDVLIDAWGVVESNDAARRFELLVVGGGPDAAELELQAGRELERISFLGKLSDVRPALHAADIFVIPSRSEGLSNAVLEAMACGLPVVATRIGGLTEQIEEGVTGLFVPVGDCYALSDAVVNLLSNPVRRSRLGAAARRVAERQFGLAAVVDAYEQLYQQLLEE